MSQSTARAGRATKKIGRILLVDDHPVVRDGLTRMIQMADDLEVCGETGEAPEAVRLYNELRPDVVIIDINLTGASGLELIKQLRAADEQARMLVVSIHDEALYAERVLRAGALGYLKKSEVPSTVVAAIRQVLSGRVYVSEQMADRMLQRVMQREPMEGRSATESLSDRELEIFQLIGQGLTTREIAEMLKLSKKTIESYREQLKAKLNLKNGAELVRTAIRWQIEHE